MIRHFASHPTAANLLMGLFILAGLLTLPDIKRETFPEIKRLEVQVSVPYPGASPADVELGICLPLEDAMDGISFMEEKRCEARTGLAVMTLKMLEAGEFTVFLDDVKAAVDGVDNFPDNSELAIVAETGRTQDVITLAITADLPRIELKQLAEQIKATILRETRVPLVDIEGFSEQELQIQIPQEQLRQFGLSLQDIANLVAHQNIDLPAGDITTSRRDYQIRFSDEKRTIDELASLKIFQGDQGAEVTLGDIGGISRGFSSEEDQVTFNGQPAAFLKIRKNSRDDSLSILADVKDFVAEQEKILPQEVSLALTQDMTSIIQDRISMLSKNAWQGLALVFLVMWLFFGTRYAFWVVMGLPVSFLASAFVLANFGVSINMLSMVALLLALGILMDDAIVISESIGTEIRHGKSPLQAAVDGTKRVARGVFSSFLTTVCIFTGLLMLEGDIGQILVVIPIVLLSVISVSLVEAFFILPNHLQHSLSHSHIYNDSDQQTDQKWNRWSKGFRSAFDQWFESIRKNMDRWVSQLIRIRYAFIGGVFALLLVSISLLSSGIIKFSAFPALEGDVLQGRLLMPTGTSVEKTEAVVEQIIQQLREVAAPLSAQQGADILQAVTVSYGQNGDAFESGPHLATISVDLLRAEARNFSLTELKQSWLKKTNELTGPWSIAIKEPALGPAGRAIEIRLQGANLENLSAASQDLQNWLAGYVGVSNLLDDLRPGKPEFTLHLKEGAVSLGLNAQTIANQLRAGFQGVSVLETNIGRETFDVVVSLDEASSNELSDFDNFPIIHPSNGSVLPLSQVAEIIPMRSFSRIHRVENQRTVTIIGDIDSNISNTSAVLADLRQQYLPKFEGKYPEIRFSFKGEVAEGGETQRSMLSAFVLGLAGVFILLSYQFKSYIEPLLVMLNIPLALVGVIWGHWLLGLDITLPSLLGFVSLAGIVVNDSILLVEFVKLRAAEGLSVYAAAARASHDRFRAVVLTSLTTIAGMSPLLLETSLQAQVLIPLATSIVFGIASSTLLVLFVIPCFYSILEDFGFAQAGKNSTQAGNSHVAVSAVS